MTLQYVFTLPSTGEFKREIEVYRDTEGIVGFMPVVTRGRKREPLIITQADLDAALSGFRAYEVRIQQSLAKIIG